MSSPARLLENYAERRARLRIASRAVIHNRVVHPIDTPGQLRDPFVRHASPLRSTIAVTRLVVLAVIAHAVTILFFVIVGQALGKDRSFATNDRVQFQIREVPPPPSSPRPEAEAEDESLLTPPPVEPAPPPPPPPPRSVTAPKPAPQRKPRRRTESPPAPVDAAQPEPEPPSAPRKIAGVSQGSTVRGETGPAFPIGDPRGSPSGTAPESEPRPGATARRDPSEADVAAPKQRAASRIPTRDSEFIKPKRLAPSKPKYPPTLRAQGIEGEVLVRVRIGADGEVQSVVIAKSSGHDAFDDTARAAAESERFSPAQRDGRPVPYTLSYTYRFRIDQ